MLQLTVNTFIATLDLQQNRKLYVNSQKTINLFWWNMFLLDDPQLNRMSQRTISIVNNGPTTKWMTVASSLHFDLLKHREIDRTHVAACGCETHRDFKYVFMCVCACVCRIMYIFQCICLDTLGVYTLRFWSGRKSYSDYRQHVNNQWSQCWGWKALYLSLFNESFHANKYMYV